MTDGEIREKYQRESSQLGKNDEAITKFINMLHIHEKSDNNNVKTIISSINKLENIAPNFTIFQSDKNTFFMHQFKALQISTNSDELKLSHEFGHAILGMINKVQILENFEEVVKRAREHCISPENKDKFREYMEYLTDSTKIERTMAEKGPVSDIISSIFQNHSFRFQNTNTRYILPSFHDRSYYFDEDRGKMKTKQIFDEGFANFYALVANNCHRELETLRTLFGEEYLQIMQKELEKASNTLTMAKEKNTPQAVEQIKNTIIGVNESAIPEKIEEKVKTEEERRSIK